MKGPSVDLKLLPLRWTERRALRERSSEMIIHTGRTWVKREKKVAVVAARHQPLLGTTLRPLNNPRIIMAEKPKGLHVGGLSFQKACKSLRS